MRIGLGISPVLSSVFGGASPWTPAAITTEAWYDASDASTITESGGSVSQWDDKSGNGYHATQGTGSNQPLTNSKTINGRNTISLDGSNDYLSIADTGWYDANNISIFLIARNDSPVAANRYLISNRTGVPTDGGWSLRAQSTSVQGFNASAGGATAEVAVSLTDSFLVSCYRATSIFDLVIYGTGAGSQSITTPGYLNQTGAMAIGADNGVSPTGFYDGDIGEIIMVSGVTTDTRQKIEGYLAWKWSGAL